MASRDINYTPSETCRRFMLSNARMRVLMGPVGSGKSVASVFEVIKRAQMQNPNHEGLRKTRAAVVRQTVRQLQDTTIKTFLDWFPEATFGVFRRTEKTYHMEIGDVRCEVMFRALDDANDVANLNSLEVTFAWFNECRDISPEIIDAMSKRVGRYPSSKNGGPTWFGMWGDTNPPTIGTWWHNQMEGLNPKDGITPMDNGWEVFKQPSGRSPQAENIRNLPEGYYDTMGRSEDYIRVYVDGLYGLSKAGKPVFSSFRRNEHVSTMSLQRIPSQLVIGMDLGLTPAAVIGQMSPLGQVLILDEVAEDDMPVSRFIPERITPLIRSKYGNIQDITIVVDPSGTFRAGTDAQTAVNIIKFFGYSVIPASTNRIQGRLAAVDEYLNRRIKGKSALLIDPKCRKLIAALEGGYRYHKSLERIEKDKHSHIADALQYFMLYIGKGIMSSTNTFKAREVVPMESGGWT